MPLQLGLIYDSGEEGIVLRAQCKKRGLPNPERVYAMKVLTNFFASQTATQVGELARHALLYSRILYDNLGSSYHSVYCM